MFSSLRNIAKIISEMPPKQALLSNWFVRQSKAKDVESSTPIKVSETAATNTDSPATLPLVEPDTLFSSQTSEHSHISDNPSSSPSSNSISATKNLDQAESQVVEKQPVSDKDASSKPVVATTQNEEEEEDAFALWGKSFSKSDSESDDELANGDLMLRDTLKSKSDHVDMDLDKAQLDTSDNHKNDKIAEPEEETPSKLRKSSRKTSQTIVYTDTPVSRRRSYDVIRNDADMDTMSRLFKMPRLTVDVVRTERLSEDEEEDEELDAKDASNANVDAVAKTGLENFNSDAVQSIFSSVQDIEEMQAFIYCFRPLQPISPRIETATNLPKPWIKMMNLVSKLATGDGAIASLLLSGFLDDFLLRNVVNAQTEASTAATTQIAQTLFHVLLSSSDTSLIHGAEQSLLLLITGNCAVAVQKSELEPWSRPSGVVAYEPKWLLTVNQLQSLLATSQVSTQDPLIKKLVLIPRTEARNHSLVDQNYDEKDSTQIRLRSILRLFLASVVIRSPDADDICRAFLLMVCLRLDIALLHSVTTIDGALVTLIETLQQQQFSFSQLANAVDQLLFGPMADHVIDMDRYWLQQAVLVSIPPTFTGRKLRQHLASVWLLHTATAFDDVIMTVASADALPTSLEERLRLVKTFVNENEQDSLLPEHLDKLIRVLSIRKISNLNFDHLYIFFRLLWNCIGSEQQLHAHQDVVTRLSEYLWLLHGKIIDTGGGFLNKTKVKHTISLVAQRFGSVVGQTDFLKQTSIKDMLVSKN